MSEDSRSSRAPVLFAFGLGLLLYILWTLRHTILLIYVSVLFAIIVTPAVHRIQKLRIWRWSPGRGAAVCILLVVAAGAIAAFAFLMVPPIVGDIHGFTQNLPLQLQRFVQHVQELPFGHTVGSHFDFANVTKDVDKLLQQGFGVLQSLAGGVMEFSLLLVLTIYFILDGPRTFEWAMSLVGIDRRLRLRQTLLRAEHRVHKWLTGQLSLMLIFGCYSAVALGLLHVHYFYALALFAGLANFIPVIGPVATICLAGAIAATDSWWKVLAVIVLYLIYLQFENAYISPRIMESAIGLPGVAIIVALAIGGALAGVLGALVAVPSAALIASLIDEYLTDRNGEYQGNRSTPVEPPGRWYYRHG